MTQEITLVSAGRHTRLGDVLESALGDSALATLEADALIGAAGAGKRLLFAVSSGAEGALEPLARLTGRFISGDCDLRGAVCAAIVDANGGGSAYAAALGLLLAANGACAALPKKPLLAANKDLRNLSPLPGAPWETPYARYCRLAGELIERLAQARPEKAECPRVRICTPLEDEGAAREWRAVIERALVFGGAEAAEAENDPAESVFLLCENARALPDARTLAVLDDPRGGSLRAAVASPRAGAELFCMLALERACAQGNYSLQPNAFTVLEGFSAAEALTSKTEVERVKAGADLFFSEQTQI